MGWREWAERLYQRSPGENLRDLRQKVRTGSADFPYDYESVRRSAYHMDARRPVDRFFRYRRILKRRIDWQELDYEGKSVVEIGCGPLLGWAPIAVYLDCERYVCVEPQLHEEVFRSAALRRGFFLPLHYQLEALFERGMTFDAFHRRLLDRVETVVQPFESSGIGNDSADLVFSNGVLQHVLSIDACLEQIRNVSREGARQLHVMNFTDHHSLQDEPFARIYSKSPESYFERESLLNLKRPSEMVALFEAHGLSVRLVPYFRSEPPPPANIDPYWSRFTQEDLAIQIAFLVD